SLADASRLASAEGEAAVLVELAAEPGAAAAGAARRDLYRRVSADAAATGRALDDHIEALRVRPEDLDRLSRAPGVRRIEPDRLLAPQAEPNIELVGAPAAWSAGRRGETGAVAIIDSGVDAGHPQLSGRVVYEACFTDRSCPNGASEQTGPGAAAPCGLVSGCWHGTHMAGVAAGARDIGVAPGAKIAAFAVLSRFADPADCGPQPAPCILARVSDVVAALARVEEVAAELSISAVNLSLAGETHVAPCDDTILAGAIGRLRAAGVATVVASGNGGHADALSEPACASEAITVAASHTDRDAVYLGSNSSPLLDLWAPGVSIRSAVPGGEIRASTGTSPAAAHVTGAWALAAELLGGRSVDRIEAFLEAGGLALTDPRNGVTAPRLALRTGPSLLRLQSGLSAPAGHRDVVGDFNGDGVDDIIWYGNGVASDLVWWSSRSGAFSAKRLLIGSGLLSAVGDFNGDGIDDVLWFSPHSGGDWIWWGSRQARFSGTQLSVAGDLTPVAGDFDGNGAADILWFAPGSAADALWLGGPGGAFRRTEVDLDAAGAPLAGDYDGDGRADLLVYDGAGPDAVWFAEEDGRFAAVGQHAPDHALAFAGDVNGDRRVDLLWHDPIGGVDSWWLATSDGVFTRTPFAALAAARPTLGDFNGDGLADVLWRDPTGAASLRFTA
ncbi:MAG: FG-GAP-like repeat-containing protein, partial [Acidimicrobiales bacterium]